MSDPVKSITHDHVFLGHAHEKSERKTWAVIALCGIMMVAEIVGGLLFGSIALVADGLHMSTHAGALLLAALAYSYARKHAHDSRFTFGTGKLGDLAGFTSAIILAMIALLIGFESVSRFFAPVPIHFAEAIPIGVLGLAVNILSAWLLSGGDHDHHHHEGDHAHDSAHRDNNIRAAIIHVMADAAVSVLVITGLLLARVFGWLWMDPLAGLIGAFVIASWSYGLVRDTGAILLDMKPDRALVERMRETIEANGDRVSDLHVWRLGPGHLGVALSITTEQARDHRYYRSMLAEFPTLSHMTVEIERANAQ
ncbi:MAG: CDF family Co(II)/Ni(II) efflux transporter DmeF [Rhizomicrobium sp.]